jgi:hypothetical protein
LAFLLAELSIRAEALLCQGTKLRSDGQLVPTGPSVVFSGGSAMMSDTQIRSDRTGQSQEVSKPAEDAQRDRQATKRCTT